MKRRYFNFPICLLNGFMLNTKRVLDNISDYCIIRYMIDNHCGIDEATDFFGINLGNQNKTKNNGQKIYEKMRDKRFTGINKTGNDSPFWEFYKNEKKDFDKAVLLMYLALKSIVGDKKYYKLTNQRILFNRMAGQNDKCETLPKEIAKFCTRYQIGKIEMDLKDKYNVAIYAYRTRGKYYSFQIGIKELAQIAEEKKQINRQKKRTSEAKKAYEEAKQQTNTDTEKELKRINEFLSKHPELKGKICT